MTTFTYHCKKTGLDTSVEIESLPAASVAYAIRRGLREYFDNYHASETMKSHDNDSAKLAAAVRPLVDEAHDRLIVGDVPAERGYVLSPEAAKARKFGAMLVKANITEEQFKVFIDAANAANDAANAAPAESPVPMSTEPPVKAESKKKAA